MVRMKHTVKTLRTLLRSGKIDPTLWMIHFPDAFDSRVPTCRECLDYKFCNDRDKKEPIECMMEKTRGRSDLCHCERLVGDIMEEEITFEEAKHVAEYIVQHCCDDFEGNNPYGGFKIAKRGSQLLILDLVGQELEVVEFEDEEEAEKVLGKLRGIADILERRYFEFSLLHELLNAMLWVRFKVYSHVSPEFDRYLYEMLKEGSKHEERGG